ncbi:SdpI/YhfL family protein [Lacinutrix venerupis]|uniref:SdpI family protein n=1 Tax=Lacinutrix venerupis TaxID=1486034 RepID=UPI000EB48162|nr:SdpI family protein [Lacinutrix venerupis]RLJ62541.1 SdpI/YhfL family protein [Lacinutrix venerupis]
MEQLEYLINPLSLSGIVFIILGIIMYKFPPKKINMFYGYRTDTSMKNQQTWDFAQKYSSKKMVFCGCIKLLLGIAIIAFNISNKNTIIISLIIIGGSVLYMLLKTEKALKNKFKKS